METKLLRRDKDRKTIAGICSGIARHTNTDPVLWKLIFVFGAFTPFPMILTYIVMWIIVPEE